MGFHLVSAGSVRKTAEGRSQKKKKKKKKRFFKVDLNLANVEADLLLVDRLYYKLATIHVLALLLSHVSHEI